MGTRYPPRATCPQSCDAPPPPPMQMEELSVHRSIANLYKQKSQWHKALSSLKAGLKIASRQRAQSKGAPQG